MLNLAQQPKVQNPLTQRALHAADGYLYLGMQQEALEELDSVDMADQGDPALLLAVTVALFACVKPESGLLRGRVLQSHHHAVGRHEAALLETLGLGARIFGIIEIAEHDPVPRTLIMRHGVDVALEPARFLEI